MAQTNEEATAIDANVENDKDNSSLEDWTLLDKFSNDSITKRSISTPNEIKSKKHDEAIEATREAIQVLNKRLENVEVKEEEKNEDDINRVEPFVQRDIEESNECDNKNGESKLSYILRIFNTVESFTNPVKTFTHIISACLLAAVIGFGIGCLVGKGETQLPVKDVNFGHVENPKYIERTEQMNKEIHSPDITIHPNTVLKKSKINVGALNAKPRININVNEDFKNFESLQEHLEHLRNAICSFCTMIDNSYKLNEPRECISVCAELSSISDFIELSSIATKSISDFDRVVTSDRSSIDSIIQVLEGTSSRLTKELSVLMRNFVMKLDYKLNKMDRQIKKRICTLRNTVAHKTEFDDIWKKFNIEKYCPIKEWSSGESASSELKENWEGKRKFVEESPSRMYPIGPEVNIEINNEYLRGQSNLRKHYKKEKMYKHNEEFDKLKKDYKPRKNFSKGDFASERETIELQKEKTKETHRPVILDEDVKKNTEDKPKSNEYYQKNSCSKHCNNNRKNSRDDQMTMDNWQFKRSKERFNRRMEQYVAEEGKELSWNDERAKSRKSARERY